MTHGDEATRCIGVNCHAKDGGTSGYSKPVDYYDEERDVSINISKSTWKYLLQDLTIEMETLVNLLYLGLPGQEAGKRQVLYFSWT
jgi:hypothetical protein